MSGTGTNLVDIILSSSNSANLGTASVPSAGVNWAGMLNNRTGIRLVGTISGNLTGGVFASGIWLLDVGGDVLATVQQGLSTSDSTVNNSMTSSPFWVFADKITVSINAVVGSIGFVQTSDDLCGNLLAQSTAFSSSGNIGIVSIGGNIGTSLAPVNMFARGTAGITTITADNIYANIRSGDSGNPGVSVGTLSVSGDFGTSTTETVFADSMEFAVGGDLDGNVVLEDGLDAADTIRIGGSLLGTIEVPASGLEGQITVNNDNAAGAWTGTIDVGGTPLSAGYSPTASSLGGGSAGLVPFTLHDESSSPVNGGIISIYGMFPNQIELDCQSRPFTKATLRMYGPVELEGSAPHFDVLVDTGGGFGAVGFTYAAAIKTGTGEREVEVTKTSGGSAWPLGTYRIVPKADKVTCLGAAGDPDVDSFIYEFSLVETCELGLLAMYDLNQDDTVCMQDVSAWVSSPCDFTGDSIADADDLDALMNVVTNWAY